VSAPLLEKHPGLFEPLCNHFLSHSPKAFSFFLAHITIAIALYPLCNFGIIISICTAQQHGVGGTS
jgi:hypothetical protein